MKKILITGVSSGIGRILATTLSKDHHVWGVARRKDLLSRLSQETNQNLHTTNLDVSTVAGWKQLARELVKANFIPEVIIFNAALWEKDLEHGFAIHSTEKMINTNFYGAMIGIHVLLPNVKKGAQFIAISSLSALKGSGEEGVGYAASKAALSIAFESFHQKYKNKFLFKTVFFGPVKDIPLFPLSQKQAADFIVHAIESTEVIFYRPALLFLFYRLIKLLPSRWYFPLLTYLEILKEKLHTKGKK